MVPARSPPVHAESRNRSLGRRKQLHVSAGRTHADTAGVGSLEQQRHTGALGGGEEEVGLLEHDPAVGAGSDVAVRIEEGDRLPDGQDELVAQLALVLGGLHRVPEAEVLRVDDVGTGERLAGAQIAVAGETRQCVAKRPGRQEVTQGAYRLGP